MELGDLSDRELLVHLATVCDGLVQDIQEVKSHQATSNGILQTVNESRLRNEGAIGLMKWLVGTLIAIMGASATLAGVALAIAAG